MCFAMRDTKVQMSERVGERVLAYSFRERKRALEGQMDAQKESLHLGLEAEREFGGGRKI